MKRIFTSAGALGVGILGLCNADAQEAKPWSLKAKLRGFYDDNYATVNSANPNKDDSFGIDVNPIGTYESAVGPTQYQIEYDYRLRFFEGRSENKTDNQHKITLGLANQFSDTWKLSLRDSFAYAQEPGVGDQIVATIVKVQGSYIRNNLRLGLDGQLSDTFGASFGYQNDLMDNQLDGLGSRSALLDTVRHTFRLEGNMLVSDETTALVGYNVGLLEYTSDDPLAITTRTILPEERDRVFHRFYVGAQHAFTDVLSARANVGLEYSSYHNAVIGDDTLLNPWVSAKVQYAFTEGGVAEFGVKHERASTDVSTTAGSGLLTLDMETTAVFGSAQASLFGPLSGQLIFQFQNNGFAGGVNDGRVDQMWTSGLTFAYEIAEGLSAETGYSLDRLDSDLNNRHFTRHRGFIGLNYSY